MAKLSLSWAINRKKRIRIVTGLAVLLLLFAGLSMMVSKNPKGTKAQARTLDSAQGNWLINTNTACTATIAASGAATCIGAGGTTIVIDPADTVDITGPGPNKFVMRGTNSFASLSIRNNATVTHEPLVTGDYGAAFPNVLNAQGLAKMVNLQISGNLTLNSAGKINVDGKGYPGGPDNNATAIAGNGYGPGGGKGAYVNGTDQHAAGGGGGFGGAGGRGTIASGVSGGAGGDLNPIGFNPDIPIFQLGSGAGTGNNGNGNIGIAGAYGGGGIYLKVNGTIIFDDTSGSAISANGSIGYCQNVGDGRSSCSGGGSGGMIWIEAVNGFQLAVGTAEYTGGIIQNGGGPQLGSGVNGDIGSFRSAFFSGHLQSMGGNAVGWDSGAGCGAGCRITGGGGGGGRIVVNKIVVQPVTIKKTLEPMVRAGAPLAATCNPVPAGATNCFNPYALQKNDQIRVKLDVSNILPGTLAITEEMLRVRYSSLAGGVCNTDGRLLSDGGLTIQPPPVAPDYTVTWLDVDPDGTRGTSESYWYTCTVE